MNKVNARFLYQDKKDKQLCTRLGVLGFVLITLMFLGGCETEDCVNCIESEPPVVPTGVHSISGDNEVIIQWYDISYYPYNESFNENVTSYIIYSRNFTPGDGQNNNREFFYIGEVAWNENFDISSGLHWFTDSEAVNGYQYEYAVAAVNSAGQESALSYEFVTDAPLPHSLAPEHLYDHGGPFPQWSQFDFSAIDYGRDQSRPGFSADIEINFQGGVPYVHAMSSSVNIQDFGVFTDNVGNLIFDGVSWAPANGYSNSGVLELVAGHIYVVALYDSPDEMHYAKFGIRGIGTGVVEIVWAYQTIAGLPELSVPDDDGIVIGTNEIISL